MQIYDWEESAEDRCNLRFPVQRTDQTLVMLADVVQWLIYLRRLFDGLMHGHGRSIGRMKATFGCDASAQWTAKRPIDVYSARDGML